MEESNNKIIIGVIVIIVIIFFGTALYKNYKESNIDYQDNREEAIDQELLRPKETINTKYQYKDGKNIFVGTLQLPSPCYSFNAELAEENGNKEIRITTTETEESCEEIITERTFRVEFEGEPNDDLIATLNDELVNINIFAIPDSEDIDDIDIYIKG